MTKTTTSLGPYRDRLTEDITPQKKWSWSNKTLLSRGGLIPIGSGVGLLLSSPIIAMINSSFSISTIFGVAFLPILFGLSLGFSRNIFPAPAPAPIIPEKIETEELDITIEKNIVTNHITNERRASYYAWYNGKCAAGSSEKEAIDRLKSYIAEARTTEKYTVKVTL